MKTIVLFLFALLPMSALAQDELRAEFHTQGIMFYNDFKPYTIEAHVGYNLTDRFFADIVGQYAIALFKKDGVKDHYADPVVGGSLGYTWLKTDGVSLDARVGAGDNLKRKADWRYTYYDVGVYAHLGKAKVKPIFGLGVRYYDARNKLFKDYTRVFVSIGFGI